ncbi:MAG: cytochrome c maturation protein CcmE [Planctomycetia bacterium]|nr:cytochrome c maturation protein CcmE [Planctomycetia bacterium]
MTRRRRLLLGAGVIAVALGALIFTGVRQSVVYFVTPSELMAESHAGGRAYRLGGMVVQGSLERNPGSREQRFLLTDGKASVPVYHRGIPPDLFGEGRGAVVEGTLGADGTFRASTIMAKHSEEYRAPEGAIPSHEELLRTLGSGGGAGAGTAPR